jgi:2,4-dienoyl-CoA reductase-like NADH-dependent reductase (Old Yellow Enzyme family)
MQIAHTGRQTLESVTGAKPLSSSDKPSVYFRQKPALISGDEIRAIIREFTQSALNAKEAGFDGVQIHAAHGYLLHQFLLPETNILSNGYGINKGKGIGTKLIEEIFDNIKAECGESFPVLIKISAKHDLSDNFYPDSFDNLINFLHYKRFDAIEISYGTMDYPLNIFRGSINLQTVFTHNPLFKTSNWLKKKLTKAYLLKFIYPKFKNFIPSYNLNFAARAKALTDVPVISVGGFRSLSEIEYAVQKGMADLVSLSRPFLCEPDLVVKMKNSTRDYRSKCINCNECVFMCDSGKPTTCYVINPSLRRSVYYDKAIKLPG